MHCTETDCYRDYYARGLCRSHYDRGWRRSTHRPLTDVDPVNVELACEGYPQWLTPIERRAAVAVLSGRGLGDREVGERLGLSARSVLRIRRQHGIESRWAA